MHRVGDADKGTYQVTSFQISVWDEASLGYRPIDYLYRKMDVGRRQSLEGPVHEQNTDAMMEILDMAKKHEDEKREGRTDAVIVQGHDVLTDAGPIRSPKNTMEGPMAEPERAPSTRRGGKRGWQDRQR